MRAKARRTMLIGGLALALAGGLVAWAGPHGRGHGRGFRGPGPGGHPPGMMLRHLDLSEQQEEQIKGIFEANRPDDLREQMREAREALGVALHDPDLGEAEIREAAGRVAELEIEIAVHRHRVATQVLAVLTDEQKARLGELRELHRGRPGPGGFGPFGEGPCAECPHAPCGGGR